MPVNPSLSTLPSSRLRRFRTGAKLRLLNAVKLLWLRLALHGFNLLGERKLDVAGRGHVRVDTTVRTVRATALCDSLVALDVRHAEEFNVQTLGLLQKRRARLVLVFRRSHARESRTSSARIDFPVDRA